MGTIEHKFDIGQKVYCVNITSFDIISECKTCLGKRSIKRLDDSEIKCPTCDGSGTIKKSKLENKVSQCVVYDIHIDVKPKYTIISYCLSGIPGYTDEESIFENQVDANNKCEILNNK